MDPLAEEIARLRARAAPPDALAEIAALRARLAHLEAVPTAAATQPTEGAPNMENAIRNHYSPTTPPPDRERKRLEAIARQFIEDPQQEDALRQRAKMGAEAHDAALRAMGGDPLGLALYSRGRDAAIKLGTFVPATTPKEGSK